jgi:hypothetical protein
MRADCLCRPVGSDRLVEDVESGFTGTAQQSGSSGAGVDEALDPNDGCDMLPPIGSRERFTWIEDGDCSAFKAAAAALIVMVGTDRGGVGDEGCNGPFKRRLVGLDLNDQGDFGLLGDLEMFFWQWSASSVTMVPRGTPSSARSACAAGISLDFSAISTWASTRDVSVANALNTWATEHAKEGAARSRKLSKLPRSVLPSRAMLACPGVAHAVCRRAASRRNTVSTSAGSSPLRM